MGIIKDPAKKHLIFAIIVAIIASIIGYFLVFYPFEVPLFASPNFTIFMLIVGIFFLISLICAGIMLSMAMLMAIKKIFIGILQLNNWGYDPRRSLRNINLVIPLSLYLIIFWTYFNFLGKDIIFTLLLGWLGLIITRAAHYVDPKKVGSEIGKVIGSFAFPFWIITICFYVYQFLLNDPIDFLRNNLIFIQTFIMLLIISFILEIIMYIFTREKSDYKEGEKLWNKIMKYRRQILISIGIFCVISAVIFWLYATYLIITTDQTIDAAGYYSIGIGLFSVGIALLSYKISRDSDQKMEDIGGSNFFGAVANLQSVRLDFFDKIRSISRERETYSNNEYLVSIQNAIEYATWESYTYIKQALKLKRWAASEDRDTLIKYLEILSENVLKYKAPILKYRHVEQLLMSCQKVCELEEIKKHEVKLKKLFKDAIGRQKKQDKDFCSYINRNLIRVKKVAKKEGGLDRPFKPLK